MLALKFDFRDLFRAPRLAFSLQRMWILLVGLGGAGLIYLFFTYVALVLGGHSLASTWRFFGILPVFYGSTITLPWYGWLVHSLGVVLAAMVFLLANTALSRALYMSAKGEHFYSWRQAYAFAWRKLGAVVMTPVSLALLILLFIGGAFLIGLAGRIPWIGEVGFSLFTILWFGMAILLLYCSLVLLISFCYTPAIIASTDEDAFEAVFQLYALTWNQPWRLLAYGLLSLVISLFSFGLFAFVCKQAVGLTNLIFTLFMGSNFADLANNGQALVQAWTSAGEGLLFAFFQDFTPLIFFTQEFGYLPVHELARPTVAVAGFIYAVSLLFLAGWVLSYGLATLNNSHLLAYLYMRKRKDGVNLLERKDKEEESEEELDTEAVTEEPTAEQN